MRITLIIISIICSFDLWAQLEMPIGTIVKYIDGSIFQGKVIKEDLSFITMKVTTGDTLQIRKIFVKKRWETSEEVVLRDRGKFHYKHGYFASFSLGQSLTRDPTTQLNLLFGQRLNERYSVGVGTGLHFNSNVFNSVWRNNDFIPVYLYGRRYVNHTNSGAFVSANIGYGFPNRNSFDFEDYGGGFYAEPGVGLHFASRSKIRYIISFSQYIQHTKGEDEFTDAFANPFRLEYSTWFFRPVLKFGIEFK